MNKKRNVTANEIMKSTMNGKGVAVGSIIINAVLAIFTGALFLTTHNAVINQIEYNYITTRPYVYMQGIGVAETSKGLFNIEYVLKNIGNTPAKRLTSRLMFSNSEADPTSKMSITKNLFETNDMTPRQTKPDATKTYDGIKQYSLDTPDQRTFPSLYPNQTKTSLYAGGSVPLQVIKAGLKDKPYIHLHISYEDETGKKYPIYKMLYLVYHDALQFKDLGEYK